MTDDASPENLRKFLESEDPALVRMGIAMAKGSGVPDDLLGEILWMYMLHDDKTIRAAAKSTFIKLAPEDAKQAVKENWKASYRTDTAHIRFKLGILGKALCQTSVSLVGQLNKALGEGNSSAAGALGNIGDERAVEPLIKALSNNNGRVRLAAAGALGKIGDERAVEPLIGALSNDNGRVRQTAAGALGKIGDERAVEPLIEALRDEEYGVRKAAAGALDKLGWVPETDGQRAADLMGRGDWESLIEWGEPAVEPLIKALGDNNSGVRKSAAEALGKIGKQAIEQLIKALRLGQHPGEITKMLGEIGDTRAVEPLIEALGGGNSSAAEALAEIGDPRAVEPLIEALFSGNRETRDVIFTLYVIEALGEIGDGRAVEPLIKALGDESRAVQTQLKMLSEAAPYQTQREYDTWSLIEGSLYGMLKVYVKAVEALGNIGDERAVEPLIKTLGDNTFGGLAGQNLKVRCHAAVALGKIGNGRAVEPLIGILSNENEWVEVRMAAAGALGEIGDERAVKPLTTIWRGHLLRHARWQPGGRNHPAVASAAKEALEKLGHEVE